MSRPAHAQIHGVRTIGIPVSDQDQALAFYLDILGLQKRLDVMMRDGTRWIEVAPADSKTSIALIAAREDLPAGVETGVRFTTEDADALHTALRADGVDVGDVLRWEGVPAMFTLRDQDGNGLELIEEKRA
jgi:lactoylglutathione lyase